jgi:hypothetical protein
MGRDALEAVNRLKPEQIDDLDDMIMKGKSLAAGDVEHGRSVRAVRAREVDDKSDNEGN